MLGPILHRTSTNKVSIMVARLQRIVFVELLASGKHGLCGLTMKGAWGAFACCPVPNKGTSLSWMLPN